MARPLSQVQRRFLGYLAVAGLFIWVAIEFLDAEPEVLLGYLLLTLACVFGLMLLALVAVLAVRGPGRLLAGRHRNHPKAAGRVRAE